MFSAEGKFKFQSRFNLFTVFQASYAEISHPQKK